MEDVRLLVRGVIRAFYTDEHSAVMEPLCSEPWYLRDDQDTFGSLFHAMGGLHAMKARQVLSELMEHGLVRRWESQEETEKGKKVAYYYVDFVHFVKTVHFRLDLMKRRMTDESGERTAMNAPVFRCPRCSRTFTEVAVLGCPRNSASEFLCPDDNTKLSDDLVNQASKKKVSSEVLRRFLEQMKDRGREEGIRTLLDRVNTNAHEIMEIRPPFRGKRTVGGAGMAGEQGSAGAGGKGGSAAGGGHRPGDIYLDEDTRKRTQVSTVPEFLLRSSVTGERTEEAILMERERMEREARMNQELSKAQEVQAKKDYWHQKLEEDERAAAAPSIFSPAPPPPPPSSSSASAADAQTQSGEGGEVFVTVRGVRVALEDVTEEHQNNMTKEEFEDFEEKAEQFYAAGAGQ